MPLPASSFHAATHPLDALPWCNPKEGLPKRYAISRMGKASVLNGDLDMGQSYQALTVNRIDFEGLRAQRPAEKMLAKLSLHPPTNGLLCLGATISGTVDFRESQQAAADDPALPKCVQVAGTRNRFCSDAMAVSEI